MFDTIRKNIPSKYCIVLTLFILTAAVHAQQNVVPGVKYYDITQEKFPRAIQVLEIQRALQSVKAGVELGGEHILGIEPLNRIIECVSIDNRSIIAAVNGDFYILKAGPYQGDPIGLCMSNGELLSSPYKRSALVILDDGTMIIDRFSFNALITRSDGVEKKIAGVNCQCPGDGIVLLTPRFHATTRPEEQSVAVLAGSLDEPLKPEGYSVGIDLNELAGVMKELGATEAMNLDGGGSTTIWFNGEIRNRPSDGRIRPVANAVVLYGTATSGKKSGKAK